jgi:primary-amine oxidase
MMMFAPLSLPAQYAKTTFPHHRKQAFDTGEYGIGALANSLELGCDCKGKIAYLDFDMVSLVHAMSTAFG